LESTSATASTTQEGTEWGLRGAVDIWVNIFTPEPCQRTYVHSPDFTHVTDGFGMNEAAMGMEVDVWLKQMDEHNVAKIIIPSMKMWSHMRHQMSVDVSVEEVAEICEAAPGRVYGAFGVNPWSKMDGVRALERAVKDHGFVAAHVHPHGWATPVNAADWYPFYAKCVELDIPVIMQIGHSAEFMPNRMGQPILVDDLALYFPELKLICAHMGWPWVEELISLAAKHPNVYIGTTAHAPKYWDPKFFQFANSRAPGKVLFGSDWPVLDYDRVERELADKNFKDASLTKMLRENAYKVFGDRIK
jgi:predicted TIM-barrel fold metal-dependent hydrolase